MAMTRHSFRAARTAEGRSEEQAFPPDAPPEMESEAHPAGLTKHAGGEHRTVPAAPSVRKLAREIGVDIYLVKGSGPGGRISEDDVKAFAKGAFARMADAEAAVGVARGAGALAVKLPDFSRWGKIEKVSLRGVRRKTAQHLAMAWNVIPHVTQFDKADVSELEGLRKRFLTKGGEAGRQDDDDGHRAEGCGFGAEGVSAIQRLHRHGERGDYLQALHQRGSGGGYRPRIAGSGDSRGG